jgi:dipeptidyl aminopeptidase/acylaminoacyl peptidase
MRLKKLAPLLLALSVTLFAARFGIDHIGRIVRLADPQIAPDGKSIALVVSRTNYEDDRYDPELVLIDIATHNQRALTRDRRGVSQARWSPDGSRLAFLATVDMRPQIFVLPMSGGDAWRSEIANGHSAIRLASRRRTRSRMWCPTTAKDYRRRTPQPRVRNSEQPLPARAPRPPTSG